MTRLEITLTDQATPRVHALPAALRTVEAPDERWEQATQDAYVKAFAKPQGDYRGCVVFVDRRGVAKTYFVRSLAGLDNARKGVRRLAP